MKTRRNFFTFLEILIVCALLAIFGGLATVQVRHWLAEEKFRSEALEVLETLRYAQDLMLTTGKEVSLIFQEHAYWLEIDEKEEKKKTFKAIQSVRFNESENDFQIDFFSNGFVMSKGLLELASPPRKKTIALVGYPHPIRFQDTLPDASQEMESETLKMIEEVKDAKT